jgi:hypothetical protein
MAVFHDTRTLQLWPLDPHKLVSPLVSDWSTLEVAFTSTAEVRLLSWSDGAMGGVEVAWPCLQYGDRYPHHLLILWLEHAGFNPCSAIQ